MENLASSLLEELNCETVFTIPFLGGIEIAESTVITWVIMAVLIPFGMAPDEKSEGQSHQPETGRP